MKEIKSNIKDPSWNFKPNLKYSFFYWFIILCLFIGGLILLRYVFYTSADISSIMIILYYTILASSWFVCIPFIRANYSLTIYQEGVKGPSFIIPFMYSSLFSSWQQMYELEINSFLGIFFLYDIKNRQGHRLLLLPAGLENIDKLKSLLIELKIPSACPLTALVKFKDETWGPIETKIIVGKTIIKRDTNIYKKNNQDNNKSCLETMHAEEKIHIMPYGWIELIREDIVFLTGRTNQHGTFYLEGPLPKGEYILRVSSTYYQGELKINLERNYLKDLLIEMLEKPGKEYASYK